MSYKAKYMKARDRFYEHSSKNEELKNELRHLSTDVRTLKDEIKMLINTILGTAPELEPPLSSDITEDEGLDQDIQELQYNNSHREEFSKNGRGDPREDNDRSYYNQQPDEYAHEAPISRTAASKDLSPHFRHHSRMNVESLYSPSVQRPSRETNGRAPHQSSRRKYEEADVFDNAESPSLNYDEGTHSPYGASLQEDVDQSSYYDSQSRPSPSRHRSQRSGETAGYHPYQQAARQPDSRHRNNGNGHHRSSIAADPSTSPDSRYSNSYAHRSYRN